MSGETAGPLAQLLTDPRLWRAGSARSQRASESTGLAELDAFLPTAGWPQSSLSEVLFAADGQGELSLVLPLLARLSSGSGRLVLVAPPYRPYAPALAQCGIELDALVVVQASPKHALWAAEQCLRAGCCAAVLCWPDAGRDADERSLRRLQLAAEAGHSLGIAFRPLRASAQTSPAALRLTLDAEGELRVLKARGANPPARSLRWRQRAPIASNLTPPSKSIGVLPLHSDATGHRDRSNAPQCRLQLSDAAGHDDASRALQSGLQSVLPLH